jgi:hypothetical protein
VVLKTPKLLERLDKTLFVRDSFFLDIQILRLHMAFIFLNFKIGKNITLKIVKNNINIKKLYYDFMEGHYF